jgi:hypothetical protein
VVSIDVASTKRIHNQMATSIIAVKRICISAKRGIDA